MEEWRTVKNNPGYEVSNLGNVRSVDREVHSKNGLVIRFKGKQLRPGLSKSGYLSLALSGKTHNIHALVAECFIGERPQKHDVNHINGNKLDNTASNLEYVSRSENMKHAVKIGLCEKTISASRSRCGTNAKHAKLNYEIAENIRWFKKNWDLTDKEIAKIYNVSASAVSFVLCGRTWVNKNV